MSTDNTAVSTENTAVSRENTGARRDRPRSARARRGAALRATTGATLLLATRRARRDAPLLLGWVALLCLVSMLALAVPRLVLDTVDRGARAAVAEVGAAADLVVRAKVGDPAVSSDYVSLAQVDEVADRLPQNLPTALRRVAEGTTTSVSSPDIRLNREASSPTGVRVEAQFGLLGADQRSSLTLVAGRLPDAAADGDEIEVVVSEEAAESAALGLDTLLDATAPLETNDGEPAVVTARIVGVVAQKPATGDRCEPEWCDYPTMWQPELQESRAGGNTARVTLLGTADGIEVARRLFIDPLDAAIRVPLRGERFTAALVEGVVAETSKLTANSSSLTAGTSGSVSARTGFPDALRDYGARAAASVAQMSLMIAGLFGTAAAVLLLVGALLVRRRSADLALERARGSSLPAVVVRSLAESVVFAAVGVGAGFALAAALVPGGVTDPLPLVVVCAFAVLAPPVQAALVVRGLWSGRRQPANRRDRLQLVGRARARRLVLELALVVLAAAALYSVRSRGLLDARTDGTDPLLAAAPVLLAVAVTLVVLRVQPVVVRAFTALAARSRGAGGLLGAAHAERAVAVLPLLALTLAVALVVGGALVVQTVREGQAAASWQRVGADARVEGTVSAEAADGARAAAGVDAASAMLTRGGVEVDSGAVSASATVIAIDAGFADLAALLPRGEAPGRAALADLAGADAGATDPLPALIDRRLAARVDPDDVVIVVDDERIPVRVVATVDGGPDGYLGDPFVYVDLDALGERLPDPVAATTLLVMGQGAGAAARAVDGADEVVTRADWLRDRRDQPLVRGVDRMTQVTVAAVALLAAIALVTTVAAGARSRSRSLSLLRTLGVRPAFGWVLSFAELAPVVAAALVGGTLAGAGILLAVGPAIGLRILAGGVGDPALALDGTTVLVVVGGALALAVFASAVDIVAHRRDNPGEVLRVGETT